jgi:hypothetical protein
MIENLLLALRVAGLVLANVIVWSLVVLIVVALVKHIISGSTKANQKTPWGIRR